ncbi:MAG: hypothetical protein AAF628_11155 [Planctomycetota bacterium]
MRRLTRPAVLPFLWTGVDQALRRGDLSGAVGRGRSLLHLIPEWRDGPVYFASLLALDAAPQPSAQRAVDQLLAATTLLEDAAARQPDRASDYLGACAFLIETRTAQAPAFDAAFRQRLGQSPLQVSDAYLARAGTAGAGALDARVDRAYLALRVLRACLGTGQLDRATQVLRGAITTMDRTAAELEDAGREAAAAQAAAQSRALGRLERYLAGDPTVRRQDLSADPLLNHLMNALPE